MPARGRYERRRTLSIDTRSLVSRDALSLRGCSHGRLPTRMTERRQNGRPFRWTQTPLRSIVRLQPSSVVRGRMRDHRPSGLRSSYRSAEVAASIFSGSPVPLPIPSTIQAEMAKECWAREFRARELDSRHSVWQLGLSSGRRRRHSTWRLSAAFNPAKTAAQTLAVTRS